MTINGKGCPFYLIFVFLFIMTTAVTGWAADSDIRLNSLGFLPGMPKQASVIGECGTFAVKSLSDEQTVYTGTAAGPTRQADVDQAVWMVDFSPLREDGDYWLEIPGVGRSIAFSIGDHVYDEAFKTVMRGFYLWRCGTAVEGEYQAHRYAHGACHLDDAWQDYTGLVQSRRDGVGGWHDAGDYGKYTVNAGVTLGVLFMAWEQFGRRFEGLSLDLPETAPGYPDFLQELKWETDWLLKMQYPDGSGRVSHKLTRLDFSGFIMPEDDTAKRYYTDWSTAATADFVAVMAMAARSFKPYDAAYADTCLKAAQVSYKLLKQTPQDKRPDLEAFSTGGYGTRDADDRLWAAAELWAATGQADCLADFEKQAAGLRRGVDTDWDWSNVKNLGLFRYVLAERAGRNPALLAKLRADIIAVADTIVQQADADIYARPLGGRYYWGCNGTVARQTVNLLAAHHIESKEAYVQTALDAIGHLFGRNVYGRSYVTGLGHRPPLHPHDRRSGADAVESPWPGYLVGGGESALGWHDVQDDYRTNEIAINWQAALVYALAAFAGGAPQ